MRDEDVKELFDDIEDLRGTALKIMNLPENHPFKDNSVEDSQMIITYIKDTYITDDTFETLLNDLDLFIDVNDENFSLSADIVTAFVKASEYIKDGEINFKEDILILLLTALDVLD